mmetsp:Transcript_33058/g.65457  ORF Transcript_33058/g.65457 Transcript_33058/m.65457 type:complete len:225 (-) Transcript_33058:63-737(-)
MSLVNVVNMVVLDNPTNFRNDFRFEISFECLQELEEDIEWKVVYVGSAEDPSKDQVLEEVCVGPVPVGLNRFVLEAPPPDPSLVAGGEVLGVTVALVTCSYRDQEFCRVGYYVNNEYADEYDPEVGPPQPLDFGKVNRLILADKPRVTRFTIDWSSGDSSAPVENQGASATGTLADAAPDAEEEMADEDSGADAHQPPAAPLQTGVYADEREDPFVIEDDEIMT